MADFIEELSVEALIAAPGCPEILVERMLHSALVEFYRDTKAWRMVTDNSAVIKGINSVELDLPADTALAKVYWVKLGDKPLMAISNRNVSYAVGPPKGYAFNGFGREIQLDVAPEESLILDGITAYVALQPLNSLTEVPDDMFSLHRDGILYGAIAKLLATPNVAWGNLDAAATYASMAASARFDALRQAENNQAPVVRVAKYGGI